MNRSTTAFGRAMAIGVALLTTLLTTLTGCGTAMSGSDFDQSAAWKYLEDALRDTVEKLPDFPGFEKRGIFRLDCADEGQVIYEIHYAFTIDASQTPQVREEYPDLLKRLWEELGYEVHRDDVDEDLGWRDLEARRSDGVNLWYSSWELVSLVAQSGCIDRVEDFEEPCIAPLGGVTEENDTALKDCPNGYKATQTADAIAPFEDGQTESTWTDDLTQAEYKGTDGDG